MRNRDMPAARPWGSDMRGGLTKREEAAIRIASGMAGNADFCRDIVRDWGGSRWKDGLAANAIKAADHLFDRLEADDG